MNILKQVRSYAEQIQDTCIKNDSIPKELYAKYGVNRGLRDINGNGVLTGLTNISEIISSKIIDGEKVQCDGELWYRGYHIQNLINSLGEDEHKYADVRILIDRKGIVLRIRCGGKIFDPIHWYHEKKATMTKEELMLDDSLGIRLIDEKSKQILFKSTFGVNNLIVVL